MSKHIWLLVTVSFVMAMSFSITRPLVASPPLSQQDGAREAVLRYLFHKYGKIASDMKPPARVFFVGGAYIKPIGQRNRDLSDALMQRFSANIPPVRKVSREVVSGYGFKDKVSGTQGIVFLINNVMHISKNSATVEAEVFTGAIMMATEAQYDLVYNGVRWKVVKEYNVMST